MASFAGPHSSETKIPGVSTPKTEGGECRKALIARWSFLPSGGDTIPGPANGREVAVNA